MDEKEDWLPRATTNIFCSHSHHIILPHTKRRIHHRVQHSMSVIRDCGTVIRIPTALKDCHHDWASNEVSRKC